MSTPITNATTFDEMFGDDSATATATTLDDLVTAYQEQEKADAEAKLKQVQAEQAERNAAAIARLREKIEATISPAIRERLPFAYSASDKWGRVVAEANAYDHAIVVWINHDGEWEIHAQHIHSDKHEHYTCTDRSYRDSDVERVLMGVLIAAKTHMDRHVDRGEQQTMAKAWVPSIPVTLIKDSGGARTYVVNARTGCGSLNQFTSVVARVYANGAVEVAQLSGEHKARTRQTRVEGEIMTAILPLLTELMAAKDAKISDESDIADEITY